MIRNLGQVAAIYIGSSAPRNTNLIWLDNTVVPFVFRAYDGSAWSEIATHKWVRAYVDGWLITLPPRQLADDGDYMLINSNNVNYKITVKDFVKSAVGNPLDFKGVIRVSADFPNPSTLESGDMYVIITSPAGGTVTDPYSGKTFEDSEKIVWDEVTQSWESLGKIDITVDLTTSYSETEVTIHSSAGKETTIQGATDQLAGVMLPGQYSWLQALSNGSIVPGDPSPLTPLTPAHKHNYNDIINRLVSQQGTGESTIDPMSQKATTDALNLKFDKASVLQVSGAATDKVMSQKAVTDALKTLSDDFNNKLTNYLPLAGGTMKGSIRFPAESGIIGNADGTGDTYILRSFNNRLDIGSAALSTRIISNASDLLHHRSDTSYKIWDSYNLSKPTVYNGGAIGTPTTIYDRNLSVNGTGWTFLSATNAPTTSIFAPTTVGTKGYYLVSSGTGAPVWQQLEDLGDGKYLPLIGGTLTGQVTIQQNVDIKLRLQSTDTDNYCIIQAINAQASQLGVFGYVGDKWAIGHGGTYYEIWDKYNLSDPATKSGNNTFTGTNSFTAGKFSVGGLSINNLSNLVVDLGSSANSWSRFLRFMASDASRGASYGAYSSSDGATNYAWIGIGDVGYSNAQYIFAPTKMQVPLQWSLDDPNGNALVWSQSSTLAHLGRASGTTKIRSGNVNLIHTKGTTDYTILDSSNYTEFLPQNITWTYGFISQAVDNDGYDANSMIGVDKPKLLFNYYTPGKIVNAPTGMGYGNVLQIDGPYTSSYNEAALKTQLAFDIIHNVDNGTGRMWFRTANNLGYGDSSNWKRVLTADENVVAFITANGYPTVGRLDGSDIVWLRTPANGLLPATPVSLNNGGNSSLGSSSWAFNSASISNVYANKYLFGSTGVDFRLDTNNKIAATISGSSRGIEVGDLLVSDNYSADATKVPTNGIYSMGRIQSNDSMLVGYSGNVTRGMLGYGLYYGGTFGQGLGSEYSSGALVLYKMLNPNKGKAGYNVPMAVTGTPTYLKINSGYLTLGVGENKAYTAGEDVTVTEYTVLHRGNGFYLGVSTACVPVRMDAAKAALATGNGYLEWWGSDAGWVNHMAGKYIVNGGSSSQFLKGDGSLDSTAYLPLTGGALSGALTINTVGSVPFIANNNDINGTDVFAYFRVKGANKTSVGYSNGNGPFIQDATNDRCIMVKSDGVYFGTELGAGTKLALITDIPTVSGYLPLSGGTLTGTLKINSGGSEPLVINNSASAGEAYVVTKTQGTTRGVMGWNLSLGMFLQDSRGYTFSMKADGVYFGASSSTLTKLPTSTDLSGYLPLAGGTLTGALTMSSRRHGVVIDVIGGAGNTWDEGVGALSVQVPNDAGQTPLLLARRSGAAIDTTTAAERLLSMELLDDGHSFIIGMSGSKALQLDWTSGKAGTGKLFGKTIATTDQIPSIPSISISNSGTGNAVTSITANGHTLTVTKGATYLTSHQTIYNLTFQAGTFSAKTFDPNGAAATVNIPTNTSHLTNDSGFITSSALNGYATQSWVNSQNFVKSTSTKKVTDIQPVDALPATQVSGVLYLVFG